MTLEERRRIAEENYRKLQFKDNFLFCKILADKPELARELLEIILEVKIKKVVPQMQKVIEVTAEGRGIRMDVFLDDQEGTVYDLEMQTTTTRDLPKRSRYYQGMIDLDQLDRGAKFFELKKSYVIFICTEDPFDKDKYVYFFENACRGDLEHKLNDEAYKVFLNAAGTEGEISVALQEFFRLILTGRGDTEFCRRIEDEVNKARLHDEWRLEYMMWNLHDQDVWEEGRKEGREEGREEGRLSILKKLIEVGQSKEIILRLGYTEEEYAEACK